MKVGRFWMRAPERPPLPQKRPTPEITLHKMAHVRQAILIISQATAKANRFKRDRSTHSRFQCAVFSFVGFGEVMQELVGQNCSLFFRSGPQCRFQKYLTAPGAGIPTWTSMHGHYRYAGVLSKL